jgi:hypothetical protein
MRRSAVIRALSNDLSPGSVDNSVGNAATISLNGPDPGILQSAESLCSPEVPEITSHFSVGVVSVNTLLQLVQAVDRTREQRKHR